MRSIFLDRDGTLIRSIIRNGLPFSPTSLKEVEILPGAFEATKIFAELGFLPVVISNQPDVGNAVISQEVSLEINKFVMDALEIRHFYICFHVDTDNCECRKPKDGLIKKAIGDLSIDPHQSVMVGDRWKDIEAGQRAGCDCYFIDYKYLERRPNPPFTTVSNILDVAYSIERKHLP